MYLVCLVTHSIIGLKLSEPQMKGNIKNSIFLYAIHKNFPLK